MHKVKDDTGWGDTIIGRINFIFMLGYGSGLWINGNLVDKLNPRYFYSFALFAVACIYALIYYLGSIDYFNEYVFYVIFGVDGYL